MALTATVHHVQMALSDVDRGVYESLDLRVAQHPSETAERLFVRTLAYGLAYEEGIAFSKGGLSDATEPPLAVRDPTGRILHWIEIGMPSPERLHKAAKVARVSVYTHERAQLLRQTRGQAIHKAESIEAWSIDPSFIGALARAIDRRMDIELTRTGGVLYVTVAGATMETALERVALGGVD